MHGVSKAKGLRFGFMELPGTEQTETESIRGGIMRKFISLRAARHAFTLVELMVAMAITLVLVYAIAEFYAYVGAFGARWSGHD